MTTARAAARERTAIAEPHSKREERPQARTACGRFLLLLVALLFLPRAALANGADLPPEVLLQAYVKEEPGRLLLLLRVPLDLLASFGLPKRGSGYLDLARIEPRLKDAAAASGRQIELAADGVALAPTVRQARVSLLSDRSFADYASALAHVEGPRLPADTDLFWNQGFFDAELEYPLPGPQRHVSIRVNVAPELGQRLKLQLELLPLGQAARRYALPGGLGWIALEPRGYEAAWLFVKAGFTAPWTLERFVLLLCLVAPFRRLRSAFTLAAGLIVAQAFALSAVSLGAFAAMRWLGVLVDVALAAALLLLAIGNLAAPSLRGRWLAAVLIGVIGGFALGRVLDDAWQFAGTHAFIAALSFNAGVAVAELASVALAFAALRWGLDRLLGGPLAVVVVSAVVGHMGWHAMTERMHELGHALGHATSSELIGLALWMLGALCVGAAPRLLPKRFDAPTFPSLLAGLLARADRGTPTRD